jgi:mRNA interferase MazF
MQKDFDGWNKLKKTIDRKTKGRFYHESEIWWCNLVLNIGNEQNGNGHDFDRPILILKALSLNTFVAIPLTTSKKESKYRFSIGLIDGKEAKAIISQIKVIDTKRLTSLICTLDQDIFYKTRKAVREIF